MKKKFMIIMKNKIYKEEDLILSRLNLPNPCPIKIIISEEDNYLSLQIGPRDYSWDLTTKEFIGAGTFLG